MTHKEFLKAFQSMLDDDSDFGLELMNFCAANNLTDFPLDSEGQGVAVEDGTVLFSYDGAYDGDVLFYPVRVEREEDLPPHRHLQGREGTACIGSFDRSPYYSLSF